MPKVFSSHIQSVDYAEDSWTLRVVWKNGSVSEYAEVPPEVGNSVVKAPSIGSAIHRLIRGRYQHVTKKPADGADGASGA